MASITKPFVRGMATFGKNNRKFFVGGNFKANGTVADAQVRLALGADAEFPATS